LAIEWITSGVPCSAKSIELVAHVQQRVGEIPAAILVRRDRHHLQHELLRRRVEIGPVERHVAEGRGATRVVDRDRAVVGTIAAGSTKT
jgi:hypothetical protein